MPPSLESSRVELADGRVVDVRNRLVSVTTGRVTGLVIVIETPTPASDRARVRRDAEEVANLVPLDWHVQQRGEPIERLTVVVCRTPACVQLREATDERFVFGRDGAGVWVPRAEGEASERAPSAATRRGAPALATVSAASASPAGAQVRASRAPDPDSAVYHALLERACGTPTGCTYILPVDVPGTADHAERLAGVLRDHGVGFDEPWLAAQLRRPRLGTVVSDVLLPGQGCARKVEVELLRYRDGVVSCVRTGTYAVHQLTLSQVMYNRTRTAAVVFSTVHCGQLCAQEAYWLLRRRRTWQWEVTGPFVFSAS